MPKTKRQIELEYGQFLEQKLGENSNLKDDSTKDVIVVCGGKEFTASSELLKLGSSFFRTLLSRGGKTLCNGHIELRNMEPNGLETTLNFLHRGKISMDEDDVHHIKAVLQASQELKVSLLQGYCWQLLAFKLSDQYFLDLWQLGEEHKNPVFVKDVIGFLARNYARVAICDDFVVLSASQLKKLLEHTDLNATTDIVVTSLLKWAKEAVSDRAEDLYSFLATQDFGELTNEALGQAIGNGLVKTSRRLFDLFRSEVSERLRGNKSQRYFNGNNLVCFRNILNGTREVSTYSIYNVQKEVWSQPKRLPVKLETDAIIISHQDYIFFIYRSTAEGAVMAVQKYSPALNAIVDCGYLKQTLYGAGVAIIKDKLYLVGGSTTADFAHPSLTAYSYEIQTRRSCEVAALLEACVEPIVKNVDNFLFVVGRNQNFPSVLHQYCPIPNQWTKLSVLPELVTRGVIWGRKLYLILQNPAKFEVFDYKNDLWYTEERDGGPVSLTGLWYLEKTGKQDSRLLFRDEAFNLYTYNLSAGAWESCRKSVWADDDRCLSVHDVVLQVT